MRLKVRLRLGLKESVCVCAGVFGVEREGERERGREGVREGEGEEGGLGGDG